MTRFASLTDFVLERSTSAFIRLSKLRQQDAAHSVWAPGRKLKLLLAGYNGAGNTGEEVRVEEIVRQFQRILGERNIILTVMTLNENLTQEYFSGARQVRLTNVFPPFLFREVPRHDGVVACCGAMFKSKFSDALTTMMIGALGIANTLGKLSVAYGGEAGHMNDGIADMCRQYCRRSSIIVRNEESRSTLRALGIDSEVGTDTAWTFEPLSSEYGRKVLLDSGWDGEQKVLAICPINPFWWPVSASLFKATAHAIAGAYHDRHYRSVYFHSFDADRRAAYQKYLMAVARAVDTFRKERNVFPILIGMERLDSDACTRISKHLAGAPVYSSQKYNAFQLVSILRCAHVVLSSRFHAVVTSMPGLVPSAGVTMDERIHNLMRERGHPHLALNADDPDLEDKILASLGALLKEREAIVYAIGRTVVENFRRMSKMGASFERCVARSYPAFPINHNKKSWEDYLPPLSPGLQHLVETYDSGYAKTSEGKAS